MRTGYNNSPKRAGKRNMAEKKKLSSVIARENKICDLAIRRLAGKCQAFEERYNLSSNEFYDRFQKGKMGDDLDFSNGRP